MKKNIPMIDRSAMLEVMKTQAMQMQPKTKAKPKAKDKKKGGKK